MPKKLYGKPTSGAGSQSNPESNKTIGLFDHIKHIQYVRDPHYYENLSDPDRKTFSIFMILRGLSMNPAFVEYAAYLYRFLDIIPPAQFYKILIDLYPRHQYKEFHRWIKAKKSKDGEAAKKFDKIVDCLVKKYEIPDKEARAYVQIFCSDKVGKTALAEIIRGYGFTDKEVGDMV